MTSQDADDPEEAFARMLNQMGVATLDQIESARQARDKSRSEGQSAPLAPLAAALIQQGLLVQPKPGGTF